MVTKVQKKGDLQKEVTSFFIRESVFYQLRREAE